MSPGHKHKIGLALGSGSARGLAHIGVIRALSEAKIEPEIVCGTSIGALVGAAYVNGDLDALQRWVESLTFQGVVRFLDLSLSGGLFKGQKLVEFFRANFVDVSIPELPRTFGAVATDLRTGREIWLQEGMMSDAVRASCALPGLFNPVEREGKWLVDGGLVNPVPVSLCRALGADTVIAVDLNSDIIGQRLRKIRRGQSNAIAKRPGTGVFARIRSRITAFGIAKPGTDPIVPSMLDVLGTSIDIMQARITRSRLAGEPADVLITPRLGHLGLLEFYDAATAISAGRRATEPLIPVIQQLILEVG